MTRGKIAWEEANEAEPIGTSCDTGYNEQGFQTHVTMAIYCVLAHIFCSRTQSGLNIQPGPSEDVWSSQGLEKSSALVTRELKPPQSLNHALVSRQSSNQISSVFVQAPNCRLQTSHWPTMSENNTKPRRSNAEAWIKAIQQHPNFNPGQFYEDVEIKNGAANVGNVVGGQSQYHNNFYSGFTVDTKGVAVFGDVPLELALQQQQQQQPQQPQNPTGLQQQQNLTGLQPQLVSKPITPGSNVHSFASSSPGHRLGG